MTSWLATNGPFWQSSTNINHNQVKAWATGDIESQEWEETIGKQIYMPKEVNAQQRDLFLLIHPFWKPLTAAHIITRRVWTFAPFNKRKQCASGHPSGNIHAGHGCGYMEVNHHRHYPLDCSQYVALHYDTMTCHYAYRVTECSI